jgi:glycerol-3-phosphate O-acyltransferase/dihydroxyacetone phosphate acyltransferase
MVLDLSLHSLVSLFSQTDSKVDSELHNCTISSLLAYSGLLHYTNLRHETLSAVIPRSRMHAIGTFFSHLFRTVLHPQFILFLPALVVHTPAYISANIAARLLATPELPETIALSKVAGGGLGIGVGYACAIAALVRTFRWLGTTSHLRPVWPSVSERTVNQCIDYAWARAPWGRVRGCIGTAVLAYIVGKVLATWHRALIRGERRLLLLYNVDPILTSTTCRQ